MARASGCVALTRPSKHADGGDVARLATWTTSAVSTQEYGRALLTFHDRYAKDVTRRSTILILGDARNNYHQAHAEVVADLKYRAKSVYWLNPEQRTQWGTGDSAAPDYAELVEMHECRNAQQLSALVGRLLPI